MNDPDSRFGGPKFAPDYGYFAPSTPPQPPVEPPADPAPEFGASRFGIGGSAPLGSGAPVTPYDGPAATPAFWSGGPATPYDEPVNPPFGGHAGVTSGEEPSPSAFGASRHDFAASQPDPGTQMMLLQARGQSERNMQEGEQLGFFDRLQIGIDLVRTCLRVLGNAPVLLGVPAIALAAAALVATMYIAAMGGLTALFSGSELAVAIKFFPIAFGVHLIGLFSQAVVVNASMSVLRSEPAHIPSSCSAAVKRLPALALFGLVSTLQRTISSRLRNNVIGMFLASLFDRAWDFATFLAVPVIMFEKTGGIAAVKRSAQLAYERWSAQLVASGALGLGLWVLSLPLYLGVGILWVVLGPIAGLIFAAIVVLGIFVLSATLNGILAAAMYRYATVGEVAMGFTEADMWLMFDRSPPR